MDGGAAYIELNWRNCFWNMFPQYHGAMTENASEEMFFNWYFQRYHKKESKYHTVTDRLRDYFKHLTGDEDVVFDVGWESYI